MPNQATAPDDEQIGHTPQDRGDRRRDRQPADPRSEVDGHHEEGFADEDEEDRQPQALVPQVLSLEDGLRKVEQAEEDRVEDQDARRQADGSEGVPRHIEPHGREPGQDPADREEQREEEQPHGEGVADLPPLEVVVGRPLLVCDGPLQGLSWTTARR
jgi:hypothetical protein